MIDAERARSWSMGASEDADDAREVGKCWCWDGWDATRSRDGNAKPRFGEGLRTVEIEVPLGRPRNGGPLICAGREVDDPDGWAVGGRGSGFCVGVALGEGEECPDGFKGEETGGVWDSTSDVLV